MSVIISIQTAGSSGRYEHFYRIECEDSHVETLRKAVTEWAKKPSDHLIGNKTAKSPWSRRQPALKPDEEVLPGMAVDAKVEAALT
jgi:hypothetical protein